MAHDNNNSPGKPVELTDEFLDEVAGGKVWGIKGGKKPEQKFQLGQRVRLSDGKPFTSGALVGEIASVRFDESSFVENGGKWWYTVRDIETGARLYTELWAPNGRGTEEGTFGNPALKEA